jgi:hypothetical protein
MKIADFIEIFNKSEKIIALSQNRIGYWGIDIPQVNLISKMGLIHSRINISLSAKSYLTNAHIFVLTLKDFLCDSLFAKFS